jgi:hypothetical protein
MPPNRRYSSSSSEESAPNPRIQSTDRYDNSSYNTSKRRRTRGQHWNSEPLNPGWKPIRLPRSPIKSTGVTPPRIRPSQEAFRKPTKKKSEAKPASRSRSKPAPQQSTSQQPQGEQANPGIFGLAYNRLTGHSVFSPVPSMTRTATNIIRSTESPRTTTVNAVVDGAVNFAKMYLFGQVPAVISPPAVPRALPAREQSTRNTRSSKKKSKKTKDSKKSKK